jgi:DNA-binding CsgD family transcriptional regulator
MLPEMTRAQWHKYTETVAALTVGSTNVALASRLAGFYQASMSSEAHRAFLEWRETVDITPLLKRVRCPTLVIHRQREDTPSLALEVAARIPEATLISIPAEGPIRNFWRDEETQAVEDFLGIAPLGAPADYALTSREREVLTHLATGLSNRDIAQQLSLSERTVSRHIANIYQKLGVHTRSAATALALKQRLGAPST